MASATASEKVPETAQEEKPQSVHMESVARVMNLPVVKRVAEVVTMVYTKIKDNNSVAKRTLSSAESIVKSAVNTTSPLAVTFQKPIEKVDNLLCSGLDYVEKTIPVVKSEPGQINDILNYISETRPMKALLSIPEYGKRKINISLVTKTQQALSELKPYFTLTAYHQNFILYEYITKKIKEIFPSAVSKEVVVRRISDSKDSGNDEDQKENAEEQPAEELQPKPEGTNEKTTVEKAS